MGSRREGDALGILKSTQFCLILLFGFCVAESAVPLMVRRMAQHTEGILVVYQGGDGMADTH